MARGAALAIINRMNSDEMWTAFDKKDAAYDGRFFVAVRTTRVYCRPSCAARPLRKNVEFFDSADAAEAQGYRPCKRCQPRSVLLPAAQLAARAAAFIESNGHARLDALSRELGFSPFHVQRVFKRVMGVSPMQYAKTHRSAQLTRQLSGAASVTAAIQDAGYNSNSVAYGESHGLGMTPGGYRAGGAGAAIQYMLMDSALGRMLVAATERGICALYFGEADAPLVSQLCAEYPNARLAAGPTETLRGYAESVGLFLARKHDHAALRQLPLDVQGTVFQAQVWQALREIPQGQTRSYAEVAQAIGRPTATRAVANACGANRVAVVIPCHRVVREGGVTGGYRWGAERKAQLLAREQDGLA